MNRNDLRLHDHEGWYLAKDADWVLPVFVIDPRWFRELELGFKKTGPFRTKFLLETLHNLKSTLQSRSSDLEVIVGKPEAVLPALSEKYNATRIIAQKEDTDEEIKVEEAIAENLAISITYYYGLTLVHPADVPFEREEIPEVFTQFRKTTEKQWHIRELFETPATLPLLPVDFETNSIPSQHEPGMDEAKIDKRAVLSFKGGESAGLKRLNQYFWESDQLQMYKFTRNGLIGSDYSSKFSPWLANGSLSPRKIYWEVKKYEHERKKNISTYWLVFELLWRDFFRYIARKHGNKIFAKGGIQNNERSWGNNFKNFERWMKGETGQDFVDANMKELQLTGFMSNRGRQNVASYLVNELDCDWRWGAAWFEHQLNDYDVCSNWGNWMYNSAVGNDPRNRKFNVEHQAKKYDKDGAYRKLWLNDHFST